MIYGHKKDALNVYSDSWIKGYIRSGSALNAMLLTLISSESGASHWSCRLSLSRRGWVRQSDNAVKTEHRIVQCVGVTH